MGPGNPYLSMPEGSTGETRSAEGGRVDIATGIGTGTGVGGGGIDGDVAGDGVSGGPCNVGVGLRSSFRARGINIAVSDAPAKADVAAIMAMVVLDIWRMIAGGKVPSRTRRTLFLRSWKVVSEKPISA